MSFRILKNFSFHLDQFSIICLAFNLMNNHCIAFLSLNFEPILRHLCVHDYKEYSFNNQYLI